MKNGQNGQNGFAWSGVFKLLDLGETDVLDINKHETYLNVLHTRPCLTPHRHQIGASFQGFYLVFSFFLMVLFC